MRRFVACCLVAALVEMAGLSATLHTHEYVEHDHPEHHHGLAAHNHQDTHATRAAHDDHDASAWTRCDPTAHRTAVRFTPVESKTFYFVLADVEQPFFVVADRRSGPRLIHADVRVHGPPIGRQTQPRAPPVIVSRSIT